MNDRDRLQIRRLGYKVAAQADQPARPRYGAPPAVLRTRHRQDVINTVLLVSAGAAAGVFGVLIGGLL